MSGFISVLIVIVCALLLLIVLVQNSKGGGLSSSFASNNQIMGVRKTADFLEKATWGFAIALFLLSLLASPRRETATDTPSTGSESVTRKKAEGLSISTAPVTAAPQQQAPGAAAPAPQQGAPAQQPVAQPQPEAN